MQVSAVQFKARKGRFEASLDALCELVDRAAAGADLLVAPEMALTGYVFPDREAAAAIAEPAAGPTLAAFAALAARHACWIVIGFPERDGDALYNSALVIDASGGLAGVYRKTLLYELDRSWARPGPGDYLRFDTAAGAFAVGICMDLNDDRFLDWLAGAGVQALAFPTNWLEQNIRVWDYWAWRLAGSDVALVAANTWGREDEVEFCGQSAVIAGRSLLAGAGRSGDRVLRAELPAAPAPPA